MPKTNYIYLGPFASFEAANFFAKHESEKDFPWNVWAERQRNFLNLAKQSITPRPETLTDLITSSTNPISVVDVGAGSAWMASLIFQNHPDARYIAVENEASILEFSCESDPRINWELSLSSVMSESQILYANSSVQYPEVLESIWEYLSRHCPKKVVFDDVPVSSHPDIWVAQRYYGHLSPMRVFSHKQLSFGMTELGYRLEKKFWLSQLYAKGWSSSIVSNNNFATQEAIPVKSLSIHFIKNV